MLKRNKQMELSFSKHNELYDLLIEKDNQWRRMKEEIDKQNKENLFLQTKIKAFMNENQSNKKEMASLSKIILELNNEKQKLINEKKLTETSLEQARQKLLDEINANEELKNKFKQKGNEDKELHNKLKELETICEQLQEELSLEKSNNTFNEMNNKSLIEEINKLKDSKRWNQINKIKSYVSVVLIKGKPQIKNNTHKFSPQKLKIIKEVNKVQLLTLQKKKKRYFDVESFDLVGEIELDIISQEKTKSSLNNNKNNEYNSTNKIELVSTVIITRDLTNIFKLKENIKNMVVNQLNIFVESNTNNISSIENKVQTLEKKVNSICDNVNNFKNNYYDYLCLKFNSLKAENGLLLEKNEKEFLNQKQILYDKIHTLNNLLEESNQIIKAYEIEVTDLKSKNLKLENNLKLLTNSHHELEKIINTSRSGLKQEIDIKDQKYNDLLKELQLKDVHIKSLERLIDQSNKPAPGKIFTKTNFIPVNLGDDNNNNSENGFNTTFNNNKK